MRKTFWMIATIMFAVSVLTSCSSDDDEDNPYVGTKWVTQNPLTSLYGMFDGKAYWHVIEFTSNSTYDLYYEQVKTGIRGSAGYFSNNLYEYKDSHIIFHNFMGDGDITFYKISSGEIGDNQNRKECSLIYNKQ